MKLNVMKLYNIYIIFCYLTCKCRVWLFYYVYIMAVITKKKKNTII